MFCGNNSVASLFVVLVVINVCVVLGMEPNVIPEAPAENAPDRRDSPPLPLPPLVKTNKRFFRPPPRTFVERSKGLPPLPEMPKGSPSPDIKKKPGGAFEDENYDVEKGKKIIRPPVHLKFDVDPPERLALEDDQRKVSYETEHKLISDALKEEKKDYEKSVGKSKDQEMLVKNDVDHVEKNTNAKRTD